jgi:hypothetical protein
MGASMLPGAGIVEDIPDTMRYGNMGWQNLMQGNLLNALSAYSNAFTSSIGAASDLIPMAGAAYGAGKALAKVPWDVIGRDYPLKALINEMGQVDVWHGSPHRFDKFTTEKIGTGEGAQAFGWGLYFTDKKDIAKHYSDKLGGRPKIVIGGGRIKPKTEADRLVESRLSEKYRANSVLQTGIFKDDITRDVYRDIEKSIGANTNALKDGVRGSEDILQSLYDQKLAIERFMEHGVDYKSESNIYKATLHKGKDPSEYTWLDWDENVSEEIDSAIDIQLEKEDLNRKFGYFLDKLTPSKFYGASGRETYKALSMTLGSDKEASLFLNRAGIDGIRYPAGSLSGVESKAKNYVVFDENAVTIEELLNQ